MNDEPVAHVPAQMNGTSSNPGRPPTTFPALVYGLLFLAVGLSAYFLGVLLGFGLIFFHPRLSLRTAVADILWYSGIPVIIGLGLMFFDLYVLLPKKRTRTAVAFDAPANTALTVVLTAYDDEASIGMAVQDFRAHPTVKRVVVVDNNSHDRTPEVARAAGAIVVLETQPGYGHCVSRALREGSSYSDTELTLLCEGDMTFRAYDIDKFLAYIPHADLVNGTRIVEQLRARDTQLTTFMYYGNFFTGKLLEAKHIGRGTFTDVGTTYKLCRNRALRQLLPFLNPRINLEFNAHFLDRALACGFSIVECPVTFHDRVGISKGGNASNARALKVGLRMMAGILLNHWKID